jgi:hypothetical protein
MQGVGTSNGGGSKKVAADHCFCVFAEANLDSSMRQTNALRYAVEDRNMKYADTYC